MKNYLVKTPAFIPKIYRKRLWHFDRKEKVIYLTFDDGPTPVVTDFTLDVLKEFNAKATFFCIGKNIENNPGLFQKIQMDGHAIGNHTYNHLNGWKTPNSTYFEDISKTDTYLDQNSKLFRPPYGKMTNAQAHFLQNKMGYTIVMWDVLSADFDLSINNEDCLKNVMNHSKNGSIIVFHDSEKAAQKIRYVLPKILKHYTDLGFQFKKIPQN